MTDRKVYIKSAAQVSLQQPLSEAWMEAPVYPEEAYARSIEPNFHLWLQPLEMRRMGTALRRAHVTAMKALQEAGIACPDGIVTGTGLGCIENTELFLDQLCREGEEMLKPTHFMQSTHNTVSSQIAIRTKCHGYNSTYSHRGISFDCALLDAFIQMRLGDLRNALVTATDELTPSYFKLLQSIGQVGQPGQATASEASVAMMLTGEPSCALCEIADMGIYSDGIPDAVLTDTRADAVMMGYSGHPAHDAVYDRQKALMVPLPPVLRYKHLFGEGYSASALGIYAAAHIVKRGLCPAFMRHDGGAEPVPTERLLFLNHTDGQGFSFVVLKRAEGSLNS